MGHEIMITTHKVNRKKCKVNIISNQLNVENKSIKKRHKKNPSQPLLTCQTRNSNHEIEITL
jgi:hypothetical protein